MAVMLNEKDRQARSKNLENIVFSPHSIPENQEEECSPSSEICHEAIFGPLQIVIESDQTFTQDDPSSNPMTMEQLNNLDLGSDFF